MERGNGATTPPVALRGRHLVHGTQCRSVSVKNLLMLFAPKFDAFGRDVGRAVAARCGGARVHGLCTGPRDVREHVESSLGDLGGQFWQLEELEVAWLSAPAPADDLKQIDLALGPGTFGRIVTADRRVGRGFVHGGLTRPDRIGRRAVRDPDPVQRYVAGLYRFLASVLSEVKPDLVFCYAVAGAPAVALAEMCRARSIPFSVLTYTRIEEGHIIDEDAAGRLPSVARRFKQARDGQSPFAPSILEAARAYLVRFRAAPVAPKSMAGSWVPSRAFSAVTETALITSRILLVYLMDIFRGRRPGVQAARQLFKLWVACRRRFAGRTHFSSPDDLPEKFIYFPLHIDPEASTMVLSPWHTDQLAVVEALAKSAPAHMRIVVKEHSPMLGLRPRGYYRRLARMPGVMLLHPRFSSFELIKKSTITAVITGTAAWEAMLFGRPALIVGDSPFRAIGEGFVYEPELTRLPMAIEAALALPPASDRVLTLYIAALQSESFDIPMSLLWGTYERHPADQQAKCSNAIAGVIVRLMSESKSNEDTG